ncbi:MAG: hypothetical protein V1685_00575 [Parcubacteria group bacterium]
MTTAINIAILPPKDISEKARELNKAVNGAYPHPKIVLDETHFPHITLVQAYVDTAKLEEIASVIELVIAGIPALSLTASSILVDEHGYANMVIEKTTELLNIRQTLVEKLESYHGKGDSTAFFGHEQEDIAQFVIDYVQGFFKNYRSAGTYFAHITLGLAHNQPPAFNPMTFTANRIALCHEGNEGTCRKILHEWKLK